VYLDEIDFGETRVVAWFLDVENGNDVLVVEVAEELHFAESAQAEHGVIEGGDLFDCDFLARGLVESRAVVCKHLHQMTARRGIYQTTP